MPASKCQVWDNKFFKRCIVDAIVWKPYGYWGSGDWAPPRGSTTKDASFYFCSPHLSLIPIASFLQNLLFTTECPKSTFLRGICRVTDLKMSCPKTHRYQRKTRHFGILWGFPLSMLLNKMPFQIPKDGIYWALRCHKKRPLDHNHQHPEMIICQRPFYCFLSLRQHVNGVLSQ